MVVLGVNSRGRRYVDAFPVLPAHSSDCVTQCDEVRPSCSRCTKRAYSCRYPHQSNDGDGLEELEEDESHVRIPELHVPPATPGVVVPVSVPGSGLTRAPSADHLPVPSSISPGRISSVSSFTADEESPIFNFQIPGSLDATELNLLAHYITHTSQTIPFDDLDLYALSVGMPNLAFKNQAVMSSLLALAAACKSHDIAQSAPKPLDARTISEIGQLLALAECHHSDSLRNIQTSMQNPDSYDYLLANAALMVLYASASHSVRVHLAATRKYHQNPLPDELFPQHSQWISFTRAAHTASTAILNHIVGGSDQPAISAMAGFTMDTRSELCNTGVLSPQNGPSETTQRLFVPLVASTFGRALESLRRRTESTIARLETSGLSPGVYQQIHASLDTVSILEQCAHRALSSTSGSGNIQLSRNRATPFDGISPVSSWVASYMISVTSMESPKVLRRIIMSFLNQAPAGYLSLVQSVLDSPSVRTRAENWVTRDSPGSEELSLSMTDLLAMDIFAHWLVLVMLLDGVWWIGDIGQWELRQVISLMKTRDLLDLGETWWPESMYMVKRELTPSFEQR